LKQVQKQLVAALDFTIFYVADQADAALDFASDLPECMGCEQVSENLLCSSLHCLCDVVGESPMLNDPALVIVNCGPAFFGFEECGGVGFTHWCTSTGGITNAGLVITNSRAVQMPTQPLATTPASRISGSGSGLRFIGKMPSSVLVRLLCPVLPGTRGIAETFRVAASIGVHTSQRQGVCTKRLSFSKD
jgi:hypothetical protein